ncbi:MAG: DoxX family protein [Candidatus Zixiibacteriota bacterium]
MILKLLFSIKNLYPDWGLLVIRLGIGLSMMTLHGYGKLTAGPEMWTKLGGQMPSFGIDFLPVFWGFMAMFSEFFASLLIILGLFFRPAALLLVFTMMVAAITHLNMPAGSERAGISGASHALEFMIVFLGLYFTGPGKFSISSLWKMN